MGTAKMPRTSDPADSADDLISELARLMAEDAQGDRNTPSAAIPASAASNVDTLARPEETSPSARLNASGPGGGLYDSDELPAGTPVARFPSAGAAVPEPRSAPRFESPPPMPLEPVDPQGSLPGEDLGYENDVLGETDPFAAIPAISPTDDGFAAANPEPEPTARVVAPAPALGPVSEDDPIAELIAAQLQNAEPPAPTQVEAPPQFEETDQFGSEQPYPAEEDNFNVSPVFGLGGAQPQPNRSSDPLAEIQNLIGDAVHVSAPENLEEPVAADPQVADVNNAAYAAEAAIAAATAATANGAAAEEDIHQVLARRAAETSDAAPVADIDVDDHQQLTSTKSWGQRLLGPAIAATLLVAIGGSLWWVFGSGPVSDVEAPVLSADATVVKAEPEPVVAEAGEGERSVVFEQLSGNGTTADDQQLELVSRDQSEIIPEIENVIAPVIDAVTDVARVVGLEDEVGGLANRKVRTVTVRPDGTIVSGDDTLAGSEVLPVERPDVPALPEGTQTAASEFVNEPIIVEQPITAITNPVSALAPQADTFLSQTPESTVSSTLGTNGFAPIPRPRPTNRPTVAASPVFSQPLVTNSISTPVTATTSNDQAVDLIASLATQSVAPPVLQPIQQPTTVSSVVQGGIAAAYVQLSSQRTAEAAQQSMNEIQRRFSSSIGGNKLEIQRVDLTDRGTFFRVRMPANSIETANAVCANVKLSGGDCFVRNN